MDLEQTSAQIDVLIEHRAKDRSKENELEEMWKASERRHREKRRRKNAAAWYSYHCHMHDLHQGLAADYRSRAESLLEEPGGGVRSLWLNV